MSANGSVAGEAAGRQRLADAVQVRRRAEFVSGLRSRTRAEVGQATAGEADVERDTEVCDLCGIGIGPDHRHLLQLAERRIVCSCEACWAMRSGEGDYRPTGNRTLWLAGLELPDDLWATFQIPIGLAFFMHSTITGCVVAMYPSPGGATESELHFDSWSRMCELNPVLRGLETDIEGLVVNRLSDPPAYAIAPIDRCYALTGAIKANWEGISGGPGVEQAVTQFFTELRSKAVAA